MFAITLTTFYYLLITVAVILIRCWRFMNGSNVVFLLLLKVKLELERQL